MFGDYFTLAIRDYKKSTDSNIVTQTLDSCAVNFDRKIITCSPCSKIQKKEDIAILHTGKVVSSGAVRIQEDINNELKLIKNFNLSYSQK